MITLAGPEKGEYLMRVGTKNRTFNTAAKRYKAEAQMFGVSPDQVDEIMIFRAAVSIAERNGPDASIEVLERFARFIAGIYEDG